MMGVLSKFRSVYESRAMFAVVVFFGTWIGLPLAGYLFVLIDSRNACSPRLPGDPCDGPAMVMIAVLYIGIVYGCIPGAVLAFISIFLPRRKNEHEP